MGARQQREHGESVETSAHTSLQVEKERSILVHWAATALGPPLRLAALRR